MMDRNPLTLHRRLWLPLASLFFSTLQTQLHRNLAQPPPTANPESTTINQAPPPPTTNLEIHNLHHQTALNTTTTSTKKSEWIKNPNLPTAFNQNHNLHQKIQVNKLHHSLSLKPPQPQQKTQTQIFRLETQITKIRN